MKFGEFRKEVKNLTKFAEGWRGVIYTGEWKDEKVAIKVAKHKNVIRAIQKEAEILEKLKGLDSFPQILFKGKDFFVYRFIEGILLRKAELKPEEEKRVYRKILEIAYMLDSMGIKRDEFGKIDKNVLIGKGGKVYVLDFERGGRAKRPSNLTQFLQLLVRKGYLEREKAIELGRKYMKDREWVYKEVLSKLK